MCQTESARLGFYVKIFQKGDFYENIIKTHDHALHHFNTLQFHISSNV